MCVCRFDFICNLMDHRRFILQLSLLALLLVSSSLAYDPEDAQLREILPPEGEFEAFYPRGAYGVENGASRPAHGHGTFYRHRNPALVDVKNAPAYGFRFDGVRRFNFD
ncbi:hypothetical protein B566_EDAN000923 [Ephemera danica]|nr:hypothetical protein B566_EDAN000923 [Ephemera danica]